MSLETKDTGFYSKKTLNLRGKLIDLSGPIAMGILNVTPDSFFDGGKYFNEKSIIKRGQEILKEGGTIIDVGGYSSRPGAADISEEEEIARVIPAIRALIREFSDCAISIDTFRSSVATAAVSEGACMINDISGGELDAKMFESLSHLQVPYVLMHMRGNPQTMIAENNYNDIISDMIAYFHSKLYQLRQLKVKDVIIDPGFGFAKNISQNYHVLKNLEDFEILDCPILVGLSRKSMVYKKLGLPVEEAGNGTTALNMAAVMSGASILRVHDVKNAIETIKLYNELK
ncbi:MAG TPA: dihydropteroate synthase [Cytophagaceae bacterium]|jgi:dihydropteroate synthase